MSTVHFHSATSDQTRVMCGIYFYNHIHITKRRSLVTCPACLNRMNQEAPRLRARITVLSQILKVRGAK